MKLLEQLMCLLGVHDWISVQSLNRQPHRQCTKCNKLQALYRGAGADDWMDVDED